AITSFPTGIAHTFMAAEAIEQGAKALGHAVKVETQGSVGSQNTLTDDDIAQADVVLISADRQVDLSRFTGKRVLQTSTKPAIQDGQALVNRALTEAQVMAPAGGSTFDSSAKREKAAVLRTGPYKHLMTGVSFMLPFITAGGLLIALSFALGGIYVFKPEHAGTLGYALFQIGAKAAFVLIVPALSGYIAYSIADRPGIAPGMIGGMIASSIGAGFLGGIVSGFIAGYGTEWFNRHLKLNRHLEGLKPVLILPLLGTLFTGLLMIYVVGTPVAHALAFLTDWLKSMQGASAILLGLLLGAMMAFDMGGPVNKAAYTFATGLLASQLFTPMAAVMAAGMTPPLALALATRLFPSRFTFDEREAWGATGLLGLSFITEGAIPYAARDPLRVIPANMIGSAIAGAISMVAAVQLRVPHGGVFVLPIPNAVTHLAMYVVALVVGTVISAVLLGVFKKTVA
ncbi:MAG: fructose-specific PTS transporter subunit EIIC, partial [Thiomonas sp.]